MAPLQNKDHIAAFAEADKDDQPDHGPKIHMSVAQFRLWTKVFPRRVIEPVGCSVFTATGFISYPDPCVLNRESRPSLFTTRSAPGKSARSNASEPFLGATGTNSRSKPRA